jgi:hypothetical protein
MILISSNFVQGQNPTDTICISTPQFKKVYAAALQKKVADSLLSISERQVLQLQNTINLLGEKDGDLKAMYEGQIANLNQQVALYKDQINGYEKLLRKERFRRRLTAGAGILATGVMGYLFLTK